MNVLVVAMAVAAGIGIDAAITHGMAGLGSRPRDRSRLMFAIGAVAVTLGSFALIGMYSTESPETHAAIMKWLFFPASIVWMVAAFWFVVYYTGVRPAWFLYTLTAGYAAVLVLNFVLPLGLLHARVETLRPVTVIGARLMLDDPASPHPLDIVSEFLIGATFVFFAYAVYRTYRAGDRRKADVVAIAALVFSVATVFDTLNHYGVVSSFYTTQLCFAGVVLAMSVALRRESLRTETELAAYRDRLEGMVEERVRDLDRTNERLGLEIEERLAAEESLRRRVQELDGLQDISQTLADRADLQSALDEACGQIVGFLNARLARTYLSQPDGTSPDEASHGRAEGVHSTDVAAWAAGEGAVDEIPVFVRAMEGREPIAIDDPKAIELPPDLGRLAESGEIAHLLLLPMVARGDGVGVLAVARNGLDPVFTASEEALAQTVADALAAVVQNEWLHRRQTRQAAEEERQRLAHDLHDAVTQSIYSASLIAEALPAVWEREPAEGLHNLVRLRRLVRAALAEMRTLLFELRPAALEAAPLCTLLERLGDALSGQAQIPVEVNVEHRHELPPQVKLALYRVAQEAFSNIAKHARATKVSASLTVDGPGVTLSVVDDGRGFDPRAVAPERMGLRIMRERLDGIGATLDVTSEPDQGTAITVVWQPQDVGEGPSAAAEHHDDARVANDGHKSRQPHEKGGRELSSSHTGAHS